MKQRGADARVSVIMGSDSDLPVMKSACQELEAFRIPYELLIISAHRTPDAAFTYARNASGRGIRVIIAGAGGAAHLPGVVAGLTEIPVVGVPIITRTLLGIDSLYSIVQMPPGVPVATVGIDNAQNAALFAVSVLALSDRKLQLKLRKYRLSQRDRVLAKSSLLSKSGWQKYPERKEAG